MKRFASRPILACGAGPAATTLVALCAMVASASACGATEARIAIGESNAVRAVVAAVAAVAREMLGSEVSVAQAEDAATIRGIGSVPVSGRHTPQVIAHRLPDEQLLDLPPPAC